MAAARDLPSAYAYAATLLREGDPDRFFAALFAPADKRPHLHALYAFSLEIARIRDSVSEALPGEIRLQWWRDALQGEARGDVMANPVAAALDDTVVRFRLPRQALVNLVDARVGDLYDDPIPTLNDLEGYCGETSSDADPPREPDPGGGRRPGLSRRRRPCGRRLRRHRPAPGLSLRRAARARRPCRRACSTSTGVARDDLLAGRRSPALDRALGEMRGVARRHLDARAVSARRCPRRSSRPSCRSLSWTATCGRWSGATTTRSGR